MPSVRFQFHATPDEVVEMADAMAQATGSFVARQVFFPSFAVLPGSERPFSARGRGTVVLRPTEIDVDADSQTEFAKRNPGCLYFLIPFCGDGVLREAAASGESADAADVERWRRALRDVRTGMVKGATMMGPTGVSAPAPGHRITVAARELAASGVRLFSVGGETQFVPDSSRYTD